MKESACQLVPALRLACLLKKRKNNIMKMMMTQKSRVSVFSCRALEALFGMWIAGYWPISDFGLVLKAWLGVLEAVITWIS